MDAKIIIGANYGDEGKGLVTAQCTYDSMKNGKVLNVLTNGGPQRGHSYNHEGKFVTFKHFGSGTLLGADNYYYKTFIVNPMQFVLEYKNLGLSKDKNNVFCSDLCRMTTPFDSFANLIMEQKRGDGRHGSCGMGIWNTVKRYNDKMFDIPVSDFMLMSYEKKYAVLSGIRGYYESMVDINDSVWKDNGIIEHFIADCEFMLDKVSFINDFTARYELKTYETAIFENGQGLMLSDTGFDVPGTTPSKTGCEYSVMAINDIFFGEIENAEFHYVTRSYLTRHGYGDMLDERGMGHVSSYIQEDETNHYNDMQGEFRYGKLNIKELEHRIRKDYAKHALIMGCPELIVDVTHTDEIDIASVVEYEFKGDAKVVSHFSSKIIK